MVDYVALVIQVQRLLRKGPVQVATAAEKLGVSRRTVQRILVTMIEEGERVTQKKVGREVFYRLERKP